MGRKFKIERDYYDEKDYLYRKMHVEFEPGLTVLIGCNGCGKTTLMRQVRLQVEKELKNPCVINYDNYIHGGASSISESILCGDMTFVADSVMSSEGEKITLNMQKLSMKIGSLMKKYPDEKEFWIFLDGVDSGFSVDAIEDLKRGLFDTIFDCYPDKDIYIIASANEYEMARGEKCFDTVNCRYVNIKSYERYRSLVLKSREYKDERIKKAVKRAESQKEKAAERDSDNVKESSFQAREWKKER